MPTVRVTRTIPAPVSQVWSIVADPHHLPRWWPRVTRVEAVDTEAFTEVLRSDRGRTVRADFRLVEQREGERVVWEQEIEGTPFARVLRTAQTQIELAPVAAGLANAPAHAPLPGTAAASHVPQQAGHTRVSIELRQTLHGFFARLGSRFVRRAAANTIEEALVGLEAIVGPP